jgi:hypothetical protein
VAAGFSTRMWMTPCRPRWCRRPPRC